MVTSDSPHTRSSRTRRFIILGVAGILIAGGIGATLYFGLAQPSSNRSAPISDSASLDTRSDIAKQATDIAYGQVGAEDIDGAVATLDRAIAQQAGKKGDLMSLYIAKANILGSAGRTDQSVAVYNQAIALDPNDYALYEGLGGIYEIAGRKDEARAEYQKALTIAKTWKPGTGHNANETAVQEAQGFLTRLSND